LISLYCVIERYLISLVTVITLLKVTLFAFIVSVVSYVSDYVLGRVYLSVYNQFGIPSERRT